MNVTEEVYSGDADSTPTDAISYLGFMQDLINMIPLEYVATAEIEYSQEPIPYEDYYDTVLTVSYTRPENEVEKAERLIKEVQNKQIQEDSDLRQLALITKRLGL